MQKDETIVYTQTIVPNTMRSTYWKYFGFPGNDNHEILTKNRVVCTLCNKVISYNKNTSNLRTHLVAKHPEKLFGLNNFNQLEAPPQGTMSKKEKTKKLSVRKEITESSNVSFEVLDESNYSYVPEPEAGIFISENQDHEVKKEVYENITEIPFDSMGNETERVTIGTMTSKEEERNIDEQVPCSNQLLEVVIKDLVDPSCFYGSEFGNFLSRLGLDFQPEQMEKNLLEEYQAVSGVEILPPEQFSLGVEVIKNCDGSKYLSVFTTVLKDTFLESKLLTIVRFEGETTLDELVARINLSHCSAVVLSSDYAAEDLNDFFTLRNIPVVWCLHSVLKRIVAKVFQLKEVCFLIEICSFSFKVLGFSLIEP